MKHDPMEPKNKHESHCCVGQNHQNMKIIMYRLLALLVVVFPFRITSSVLLNVERRLHQDLLHSGNYDLLVRPVLNRSDSVQVYIASTLYGLVEVVR